MSATIDILLRASGQQSVSRALRDVGRSGNEAARDSRELGDALRHINEPGGLRRAARAADQYRESADRARASTAALNDKLEGMRNAGAGMAVVGGAGILLSHSFAQAAHDGEGVEARLESILTAQKRLGDLDKINDVIANVTVKAHLPDDDPVREAVVQMTSDQVATGDIAPLLEAAARNAEALKQPVADIGTLFAKAYAEGNLSRLKRANILFSDQEEAAVKAAFGLSEAAGRAKFMEVVIASTARSTGELGTGLTDAQKAANDFARSIDDVQTSIGKGSADAEASLSRVGASILNVIGANEQVSYSMGWMLTVGSYGLTAAGSLLSVASQAAMTGLALSNMGITGAGAWALIRTSAMTAGAAMWGAMAPIIPIIATIAAVALIAAAAIYALDKAWHYKEDQELSANIKKGEEADPKILENVNKARRRKGQQELTLDQLRAWQNDDSGAMTDPLSEQSAKPDMGGADIDKMQAKLDAFTSGKMPATPAMPAPPMQNASLPVVASVNGKAASASLLKVQSGRGATGYGEGRERGQADSGEISNARKQKPQTIEVPLHNKISQAGNGDTWIHFQADPVRIPNRGLGKLRGKVR